jgi:DNA repair exonuclease SbcCD ATPase subunit
MMDVLSLPFDQYQRYRLVADLVGRVRGERGPLAVLDVGGRTALLRSFLPDDHVTLVDVESSEEPGLVVGTGTRLPFRDDAFDVVAAFDTLEHVPPAGRDAFVDECARVSRAHVMIAGPCKSPEVDEAEELLQEYLETKLDLAHRYLQEHRDHGLPVRADVEARLARAGAAVRTFGHGNLDRWLVLMCMELYMDHDPGLRPVAARFFRFYNEALYASDHAPPVYRQVIVGALGGVPLPDATGLLDVAQAPPGAIRSVTDLGLELVAFDREKDVWRPEFARLQSVIADLEEDLDGHKARLADTAQDLAEHQRNLADLQATYDAARAEHADQKATLEADLAAHKGSLQDLERDVAVQLARYEQSQAEHAEVRATLEADLAEHRASIEQHERDFAHLEAEHRRSISEHRGVIDALEGELAKMDAHRKELERLLAEVQGAAQEIQRELVHAQHGLAAQSAELVERDATIAAQRARLRSRVDSLKRVFGSKRGL